MVQSIEDYSLWNISNRINLRRGQTSTLYIRFPVFFAGRCIMFPCISWERPSFAFCPGKKDHVFGKKIPSFQIIQERSCAGAAPFGKTIFSEGLKKISYFRVFFKKDHLSFSVQRVRSYFREKEISSFPIIQERSYPSAVFLERPSFQDIRNKKIWFLVQCSHFVFPENYVLRRYKTGAFKKMR